MEPRLSHRAPRWALLGAAAALAWACTDLNLAMEPSNPLLEGSDTEAAADAGDAGSDMADADEPELAPECQTSPDCAGSGQEGRLCVAGACRLCLADAECEGDAAFGERASCQDGLCRPCPPGQLDCPCPTDGLCDDGLACQLERCQTCTLGTEGCGCYGNGSCDGGLSCRANRCEACTSGEAGCPCHSDGSCQQVLECVGDTCFAANCPPGTANCPCRLDGAACDYWLTCNSNSQCVGCSPDIVGCPCVDHDCAGGLVCNDLSLSCREPLTCDDLTCLADHRLCERHAPNRDARCLDQCLPGYEWRAELGACGLIISTCEAGEPSDITADCQALGRTCQPGMPSAQCGGCLSGLTLDDGRCRPVVGCEALSCADQDRQCVPESDNQDGACAGCLPGFAEVDGICLPNGEASCAPDALFSIAEQCTDAHRACQEQPGGAECGVCVDGYIENPDSEQCVANLECDDIDCAAEHRTCLETTPARCGGCLAPWLEEPVTLECVLREECADIACDPRQQCVEATAARDAYCVDALDCTDLTCAPLGCIEPAGQDARCVDSGLAIQGTFTPVTQDLTAPSFSLRGRIIFAPAPARGGPWSLTGGF